jgi:ADP-heptose:LPS heptosyltransferase
VRRWGLLPESIELLRGSVYVPDRVAVFPPVGLGDFVAWLAFIKPLAMRYPQTSFYFAAPENLMPLYKSALGERAVLLNPMDAGFELALILNDEDVSQTPYASILLHCKNRVGMMGGRYRRHLINCGVFAKKLSGQPRHEALRHSRLLLPFGIRPCHTLQESALYCRLASPSSNEFSDGKPYVVLHLRSNGHGREWGVDQYAELAMRFHKQGVQVVLTGSESEREHIAIEWPVSERPADTQDLAGKLDIQALLKVLAGAQLVVAASTGPLHLASALGARSLGLYPARKGINLARWSPIGAMACAIQTKRCRVLRCQQTSCDCMRALPVEMVYKLAADWLMRQSDLPDRELLLETVEIEGVGYLDEYING